MILAERRTCGCEITLLVDVGTNAEIVLGNREPPARLLEPDRARVRRRADQLRPARRAGRHRARAHRPRDARAALQGDRQRLWSDDPASPRRRPRPASRASAARESSKSSRRCIWPASSTRTASSTAGSPRAATAIVADGRTFSYVLHRGAVPMQITQNDVRAIQLAKAALYAGMRLLMDQLGVDHVDRIRLAGAFGSHIDVKYAMVLGMIPDCALGQVGSAGNAAGTGARIALLDSTARADDRRPRAPDREDRDGGRAAIPGAFRRGHGDSAQDRRLSRVAQGRDAAGC